MDNHHPRRRSKVPEPGPWLKHHASSTPRPKRMTVSMSRSPEAHRRLNESERSAGPRPPAQGIDHKQDGQHDAGDGVPADSGGVAERPSQNPETNIPTVTNAKNPSAAARRPPRR